MTRQRFRRWLALFAVIAASLPIGAAPAAATSYVPISGVGSTWSFAAIDTWKTNVNTNNGMSVSYSPLGSTTGRNEFKNGTTDWAASDIPYGVKDGTNDDPPPSRGFAYMPDTAGGTTFMYNLHIGNTRVTNLRLSGAVIAGIFTGGIRNWNDARIAKDNPGLTLPAIRIVPVVRSDGSGATAQFTQWMLATEKPIWQAYCAAVGRNPCTQTSAYPVLPGAGMVAQSGDLGVSGYVSQPQADGAIGYVEYAYALETVFPVAKVLNAAGYYTEPTPGHVAVSLLAAKINNNQNDPNVYLTQDLSGVYTNPDPRTYPLSSYSYLILPTTDQAPMTTDKGLALGDFGKYVLCQGQNKVDALGYSALPINLVQAGLDQLRKIPGANVPNFDLKTCDNPTFNANGANVNTLALTDPQPQPCDREGPTQCTTGTAGLKNQSTPGKPGTTGVGGTGPGGGTPGAGANPGAAATSGAADPNAQAAACDPDTGSCPAGGGGALDSANGQGVLASPVPTAETLSDGLQVTLMVLAAVLLVGVGVAPPLISQMLVRRRGRRGGA